MKLPFWPPLKGYRDIKLGLSPICELLTRIGNPHLKIPPVIHIAGTNGKGSTLSFLRTIFEEANFLVHSYISPHLVNFNERIILAGQEISDSFLDYCLLQCQKAAQKPPAVSVTFFEGTTAAAFLAFSLVKADLLLLETGMGGRLDATNVLEQVLCSIITPVSFDHTEFLGKTLAKIAFEKSGIIKKNSLVLVGKQKPAALQVIKKQAFTLNSAIKIFNQDWRLKKYPDKFLFEGFGKKTFFPRPSLFGNHQIQNAGLAIAAIFAQNTFFINHDQIKSGLTKTHWPARLQRITSGKFFKILPQNYELYLDGSHNAEGAKTIADFLETQKNKRIFIIFSMLNDKECQNFLKKIAAKINYLIALTIPDESKSYKAEEIMEISEKIGINSAIAQSFTAAFKKILLINKKHEKRDTLILICGSLYLAGNFLKLN